MVAIRDHRRRSVRRGIGRSWRARARVHGPRAPGRAEVAGSSGRAAEPFGPELLVDLVSAGAHPQRPVGSLGAVIAVLDVETQADHVPLGEGRLADVTVDRPEHAPGPALG